MNERIREIDKVGAEFARVAAEHTSAHRRRGHLLVVPRRAMAISAMLVVVFFAGALAVPATRGAIENLADSFAGWVEGDDEAAPGRALRPADDAPNWVRERGGRLIAETDGVGLYVTRTRTDAGMRLSFALGDAVEVSDTVAGWRERFANDAVVVLGPALDERGDERLPLLGLTARSVERVELHYATGAPLAAGDVDGGFVLMADPDRPLREIVAYDDEGRELGRADVSHINRASQAAG